eukprot:308043_1
MDTVFCPFIMETPYDPELEKKHMFNKRKLQQIPARNSRLAFGYVREHETDTQCRIPQNVKYLCLWYLNPNQDQFNRNDSGPHIKINVNRMDSNAMNSFVNLTNVFDRGIHIWRFKCNSKTNNYSWAPQSDCFGIVKIGNEGKSGKLISMAIPCRSGEVIEMKVNVSTMKLLYRRKKSYNINYSNINWEMRFVNHMNGKGKYKAGIWLNNDQCSYTLISYQGTY